MPPKKKAFLYVLFVLLLGSLSSLNAQKIGTFQHTYDTYKTIGTVSNASSVIALPDKGFLISGVNSKGSYKIFIIRTDSLGRQIWSKTYAGTGTGNNESGEISATYLDVAVDMILTPEGNVAIYSNTLNYSAVYLLKINLNGSVLWSKTYPGGNKIASTLGMSIINDPIGGYVLTGASDIISTHSEALVMKTDSAGNIIWSNVYFHPGFQGCGIKVISARSGGYFVTGLSDDTTKNEGFRYPGNYLIMKIDKSGKLLWSKVYSTHTSPIALINYETANSLLEMPDKTIYMSGMGQENSTYGASLIKLDSIGNIIWSKIYMSSSITTIEFRSAIYDSIKKAISISTEFESTSTKGDRCGIMRLDTSGKVIFSKTFGTTALNAYVYRGIGDNLLHLPGGSFVLLQSAFVKDWDYFLVKMDSGANSDNCNTSLFSISPSAYPLNYLYSYKDTSVSIAPGSGCTVANVTLTDSLFCDPFIADFGWKNPCSSEKTQFLDSSYSGATNWKWNFGDPLSSAGADTSDLKNPTHIYTKPGTYTVKLVSGNGTVKDSLVKMVTIYQSPTPVKYFDTLTCGGSAIQLHTSGGAKYLWEPGGYNTDTTPKITLKNTATFIVEAIAANACITNDTAHVTVDHKPAPPTMLLTTVKNDKEIDVLFQKSDSGDVKGYIIYRSTNGGAYKEIDSLANLSNTNNTYFYADTIVKADSNNYTYKVVDIDSCGGGLDTSTTHTPVLLKGNPGERRAVLNWTKYRGYSYDTAIVERYDTLTHTWENLIYLTNKDSGYVDSSYLKCNKTVYYRIATMLKDSQISYSDSIPVTPYETVFKDTPQIVTVTKTVTSTTNGTVVIRWVNNNMHVFYNQLYYSANGINYNLLKDSIPVSQDSFVHTGVNTQSADQYYYLVAVDSCPAQSPKSNVHKTITLTVSVGELLHKLSWTPYEGFKVKDYIIEKLIGSSFQPYDTVPGVDTLTRFFPAPCNHVERYMIEAVGYDSGEISYSDSMGRKAIDTIPPDAPIIKNATVINGTTTRIDFKGSDSLDTYNFIVQRSIDGNWGTAGSVLFTSPGQMVTYVDSNVNTITNQLCYTVIARDSCLNVTASDTFCVIQLKGSPKNLSDSLKWSPFEGYAIGDYYILRYVSQNDWDTVGIVNGTDTQYLDKPLACNVPQTYKIEGFEKGGTEKTLSDSITLTTFDTIKPPAPTIKYATVLNGSQIELFWQKSIPVVKLYELSLKTGNGNWMVADSVNIDTSFIFSWLNTADSVYDFRIVAIDSCAANRSANSQYHSPAFLSGIPLDDTVKLNWKPYEGFVSIKYYYIYQLVNGIWSLTDSVSGNMNSWLSKTLPCNVTQSYRIGALDNTGKYLSYSDTIAITPFDTIKPPPPTLYYATVLPNQTVKLSWQWNPQSIIKYFEIWRSANHKSPVLIDSVTDDSVFIDKSSNVKDSLYSYSVIAIDSCNTTNRSKPSQTDSLMQLSLYSLYCSPQVQVHWTQFTGLPDGVSSYNILRSTNGVNFASIGSVNASVTMFIDNNVTLGQQYYYETEAVDTKSGYVSYSDTLGIIPRLIPLADSAQLVYATVLKSDETHGEIYIQWKRAPLNDTNARGYYVYSYNTANGKYALLQNITNLNDTSYIQDNINTLENSYKYYIVTYNVCDVGINSNIHKTVLLTVQNNNLEEQLNWTNYMGILVKSYSVYKSEDGGPQFLVNNAGLDSAFSDSNVTCNHNYTYQIQAMLANGEISFSDSITVKSFDTIKPKTGPILLATVVRTGIQDGKIYLDWNPAFDKNLLGYNVYRSSNGVNWFLIVNAYPGTTLSDTGLDTYDQSYYYKIQPVDSCGNLGTVSSYQRTVNMKAQSGNGFNQLAWNSYQGWIVKKYLVYRDGVLIDTVPNNVFVFKDTAIICRTVYQYIIKATDSVNDTIISSSNTDSAKASNNIPPQRVYIKTVTVSNPNKAATITWTPSTSYDVKNYYIYRKDPTGAMTFVDSTTNLSYSDTFGTISGNSAINKINGSDCYYVFARDHCGNQSDGSNQGCIIILSAHNQHGYNQLTWNSYQDWYDGVQGYNVYENSDSTGWQLIGTTSPPAPLLQERGAFTDSNLGDSVIDFCYQVEAIENPGQYNQLSRSTVVCVHQDATVFIPNTFTPYNQDGLNDFFGPVGSYIKSYSMKIYNRWGELVYQTSPNPTSPQPSPSGEGAGWDGKFQGQFVQQGVYIYLITVTDYNNKQSYFKGTITMFE